MINVVRWGLFVLAWPALLIGIGLLMQPGRANADPGIGLIAVVLWLLSGLFCLAMWAVLTVLLHIEAATRRPSLDAASLPRSQPTPPVPSFAGRAD